MKTQTTLAVVLSMFLFIGCVKTDKWPDTSTKDNVLYKGYLSFKVNGVQIENTGSGFLSGGNNGVGMVKDPAGSSFNSSPKAEYTIFSGNCPGTRGANSGPFNMFQLEIFTDSLKVGTYDLKETPDNIIGHVVYFGKDSIGYESGSEAFRLSISKHAHGVLEGTFNGALFNGSSSVTITDGAFSCGTLYK